MIKNYFKVAWRNLVKNKIFSIINIAGLGIGLACFLLISLYVLDELSYDHFYPNANNIFRINTNLKFGGASQNLNQTSDMMGATLKKDYPEVLEYTRIYTNNGSKLIKKENSFINEAHVANADSTFFSVFKLPAIAGDLNTALNEPNTVVINESTAKKYFNTTEAIGKTIETNEKQNNTYKVTAVIKNIPHNSHLNFDFIFSMKNVDYHWGQHISFNFQTYLLLKPGSNAKVLEKDLDQYTERYVIPEAKQFMKVNNLEEFKRAGNVLEFSLMPLTRIHLYADQSFEITPPGNIQYIYIFGAIAFFILIIACINFMNLTTARYSKRAKEVGIRKVLGTERKELIIQFLFESTLMVILSSIIAIVISFYVLPLFNDVANKSMALSSLFSPIILPWLIALPFVVGLLAGSYPAFYLSAFRPIEVLKGKLNFDAKSGGLRNLLVVFQFAISIILIICTLVIYKQLNYIQSRNLGFNKDQVLIIDNAYELQNNKEAFKNELLQQHGVFSGTFSAFLPVANSSRNDNTYSKDAVMNAENGIDMQTWTVDNDYIKTMGMQMVSGRNFSKDFVTDSAATIINETTAKFLGYRNPVGHKIYTYSDDNSHSISFEIIGVVKNFNFESIRQKIGPLCMRLGKSTRLVSFKIAAGDIPHVVKQASEKWKELAPGMPFSYRFLNESFNDLYRTEIRVGKIALIFSMLAIFIACLGLFGLATFIAEQRTKEIGIRKVLGASVKGIVQLLSKDFVKLVLIAFVIAAPLAWWAMNTWLQDFAYRINLSLWIFLLAIGLALFIALATISFQTIKAAIANPVKNLRTE